MNLFSIIEEVLSENASLGFGEGKPAKDELSKKQVVSLEEESEEEHDFGGLRDQAKSTDEEGVSTSFRPMKEDTEELEEMSSKSYQARQVRKSQGTPGRTKIKKCRPVPNKRSPDS